MIEKKSIAKNTWIYQNSIMENNTIVIIEENKVIIVDPSFDVEEIFSKFKDKNEIITILTHSHYDHVGNMELISQKSSEILVSLNAKKVVNFCDANAPNRRLFFGKNGNLNEINLTYINDLDEIHGFKFYLTPGHSPDSMCLMNDDIFITGDHLFIYDVGRTDLPLSNHSEMKKSLEKIKKVIQNEEERILIPGHGDYENSKTVLKKNYYLNSQDF